MSNRNDSRRWVAPLCGALLAAVLAGCGGGGGGGGDTPPPATGGGSGGGGGTPPPPPGPTRPLNVTLQQGDYLEFFWSSSDIDFDQDTGGTANVDVVDLSRKQVVWEGIAEARLTDKMMKDPRTAISNVITEMFAQYPGRAGT